MNSGPYDYQSYAPAELSYGALYPKDFEKLKNASDQTRTGDLGINSPTLYLLLRMRLNSVRLSYGGTIKSLSSDKSEIMIFPSPL